MESPGLIELYNWLNTEFTGIEASEDIVDFLHAMSLGNNKVFIVLLRDDEHPETELLLDAYRQGMDVLDLNNGLHPIEYRSPDVPKPGGRRRKVPEEREHTKEELLEAYQEASNAIRDETDRKEADLAQPELEEAGIVEAKIEGPAIKGPQWSERWKELDSPPWETLDGAMENAATLGRLEDELFGTLREIIRSLVAKEVEVLMAMSPGVHGTTESIGQSAPVVEHTEFVEPTEIEDPDTPKLPYLFTPKTGMYKSREGKKGRPPKDTEVMYLTEAQVNDLMLKGLIENLSPEIPGQMELPFD